MPRFLAVVVLAILSPQADGGGLMPIPSQQDTVTFQFAIPDGGATVRTFADRQIRIGEHEMSEPTVETEHRLEFRNTSGGLTIRRIPAIAATSAWMTESESVQALAQGLVDNSDLVVHFDTRGQLLTISGLEQTLEDLEAALSGFPIASGPALAQLGPVATRMVQEGWSARFTPFLGRSFPVGQFGQVEGDSATGFGVTVAGTTEIGVRERVQHEGRSLVRVMYGWTTQDPAFGESIESSIVGSLRATLEAIDHPEVPAALAVLDAADLQLEIGRYWFVNERLMDPGTMITYAEQFIRAFQGTVAAEGQSSPMAWRQINDLVYEYR